MSRPVKSADETDAFSPWRRVHYWRRGELKRINRRAGKRERQEVSAELAAEIGEALDAADRGETEDLGSFARYADEP